LYKTISFFNRIIVKKKSGIDNAGIALLNGGLKVIGKLLNAFMRIVHFAGQDAWNDTMQWDTTPNGGAFVYTHIISFCL
jgi:hypothetical protein